MLSQRQKLNFLGRMIFIIHFRAFLTISAKIENERNEKAQVFLGLKLVTKRRLQSLSHSLELQQKRGLLAC